MSLTHTNGVQGVGELHLPRWAQVSEGRLGHIARVTALLDEWARAMHIDPDEHRAWVDAGRLHDALRDAPASELRALSGLNREAETLHGPAVAALLEREGERRNSVLDAVRYHTVGSPAWDRTGRALYMADFLEPGRRFWPRDRAFFAAHVPHDFAGVFRQVLRARLEYSLREGHSLFPETVELWNAVR